MPSKTPFPVLPLVVLLSLSSCSTHPEPDERTGWLATQWMEMAPQSQSQNQSSSLSSSEETAPISLQFERQFKTRRTDSASEFQASLSKLREGDIVALRLTHWEVRRQLLLGAFNRLGYEMIKFGHLAMVIRDPENPERLCLFESLPFKGPTTHEGLDVLRDFDWVCYRLEAFPQLDQRRLYEFVALSREKARDWKGYDFTGAFGLWNAALHPDHPEEIGEEYICSTLIVAALHYAGAQFHVSRRRGTLDIITPYQVVMSRGHLLGCSLPLTAQSR